MTEHQKHTNEKPEENFYRGVNPMSFWRYPISDLPDMIRAVRDDLWPRRNTGDEEKNEEDPR